MSEDLPKGFICQECGRVHNYPPYVYAHWRDIMTFRCGCGARYEVIIGNARLLEVDE